MSPNHLRMLVTAARTALIIVASFISYEILLELQTLWNKKYPGHETRNFIYNKLYKLIVIFLIDLLILYSIYYIFNIQM
jgi:hypothetical protein